MEEYTGQKFMVFDLKTFQAALESCDIASEHDASVHQKGDITKQYGAPVDGIGGGVQKQNDLKVVLLNVRSLKNEAEEEGKKKEAKNEAKNADNFGFFENVKLHVFLLTETWLTKETADEELKKIFPSNYKFYHESEEAQKRKGVAIIVSEDVESEPVKVLPTTNTFQYVAIRLKRKEWAKHILIINLYRPPIPFTDFLKEFKTFSEESVKRNEEVILTGDFNLPKSKKFKDLLKEKRLKPHVKGKTHNRGNALDQVVSQLAEFHICNITVDQRDGRFETDHYPVYFSIRENEAK